MQLLHCVQLSYEYSWIWSAENRHYLREQSHWTFNCEMNRALFLWFGRWRFRWRHANLEWRYRPTRYYVQLVEFITFSGGKKSLHGLAKAWFSRNEQISSSNDFEEALTTDFSKKTSSRTIHELLCKTRKKKHENMTTYVQKNTNY